MFNLISSKKFKYIQILSNSVVIYLSLREAIETTIFRETTISKIVKIHQKF